MLSHFIELIDLQADLYVRDSHAIQGSNIAQGQFVVSVEGMTPCHSGDGDTITIAVFLKLPRLKQYISLCDAHTLSSAECNNDPKNPLVGNTCNGVQHRLACAHTFSKTLGTSEWTVLAAPVCGQCDSDLRKKLRDLKGRDCN